MFQSSPAPTASTSTTTKVPDYEVKFLLHPAKVLDSELKPTRSADRILDLKKSNHRIAMAFLDAPNPAQKPPRLLDAAGWYVRFRQFAGSDTLELSYKRRYPIAPGGLAAALATAAADGFDTNADHYDAQVEWSLKSETLSLTRKKSLKVKSDDIDLPTDDELRALAIRELPGKLDRQQSAGWARGVLATSRRFGPVAGKRWAGGWQGPELSFEVWLIGAKSGREYEPVVELSFKADTFADATGFRDKLLEFIREQGWLLEADQLKTAMILDRY